MGQHRPPPGGQANGASKSVGQHRGGPHKPNGFRKPEGGNRHADRTKSEPLLLSPRPDWYSADVPPLEATDTSSTPSPKTLSAVENYASKLLETENATYTASHSKASSSRKFMSSVMDSGTWSDKISALTLMVQETPIHTRKEFENLLGMAGKRSRDNALMALAAIKDLLAQGVLLPADRKLRYFTKQPQLLAALVRVKPTWTADDPLPNGLTKQHLLLWAFEDWLKHKYFEILQILESWCNDTVENSRMRAVTYAFELLKEKPEQEENLLRLLVNKLGDTSKKIASRASHLLLQLQTFHPQMKSIVIESIQSEILLKPGQSSTSRYYAAITLNQTVLSINDPESASKLLDVYFGVFVSVLNKAKKEAQQQPSQGDSKKRKRAAPKQPVGEDKVESELDDKIVGQILTGIHRAFPYCKSETAKFEGHIDTMFRITHSANFNTSIQALQLIQQISSALSISVDRFMRTLYESLLDPRLLHSSKQTMYLNLLYRALKADASMRRVKAFAKRLTQVLALHEPPFICGALFLLHELETTFPGLKTMLDTPELDADDDEEVFRDVPDSDDERTAAPAPITPQDRKDAYDPRKRDPDHSNADKTCLWELPPWTAHYHPSAMLFARSLLYPPAAPATKPSKKGAPPPQSAFPPKPDPTSHTLMHFLDRFAYRNPKAPTEGKAARGSSLMQPALAAQGATDTLFTHSRHGDVLPLPGASTGSATGAQPTANSEAFWSRQVAQVPVDEIFFHRYFNDVGPKRKAAAAKREAPKPKKKGAEDEEWDEDIGAGEDEIWKALVGSRPEIEDDGEGSESEGSVDDAFAAEMDEEEEGDEGVELNLESDEEGFDEEEGEDGQFSDEGDDEGGLVLDDEEGMFSDEQDEQDESEGEQPPSKKTRADGKEPDKKKKKKTKLSSLPTFASVDDYAKMIDDADEDGLDGGTY